MLKNISKNVASIFLDNIEIDKFAFDYRGGYKGAFINKVESPCCKELL